EGMKPFLVKNILLGLGVALVIALIVLSMLDRSIAGEEPCKVGSCPNEITLSDNGRVLTYPVNRHFGVVLDRRAYPPEEMQCVGGDIIERTLSLKALYPNQMQRFLAKKPGSCVLQDRDFVVTIITVAAK